MLRRWLVLLSLIALGLAVGVASHGALAFWRLSEVVERAHVIVGLDEHDPVALAVTFDDESVPVSRVEIFQEELGRGGRIHLRGVDEPVTVRSKRDEQEALLPNGARLVLRRKSPETVEATFHPADGEEPRSEILDLSEPELAARAPDGAVGIAYADDRPSHVVVGRHLTVEVEAKRGDGFSNDRGRLAAACDEASCTLEEPWVTVGARNEVLVTLRKEISTDDLPAPSRRDLEQIVDRFEQIQREQATTIGEVLTVAGGLMAACTFWGPGMGICVGAVGTAAGVAGTVASVLGLTALVGEKLRQFFNAETLDDPEVRRAALTVHYAREAKEKLESPGGLQLCTSEADVEEDCVDVTLPDLREHPWRDRVGGAYALTFGADGPRPSSKPPSSKPPTSKPPPSPNAELDPNAHCLDSIRVWLGGDRKREKSLPLRRSRSYPNGYSCRYDDGQDHVEAKAWKFRGGSYRHCDKRVARGVKRRRRVDGGLLSKSWSSTRHKISVTADSFDRHEVVDVDGERLLDLAVKAGLGPRCP